MAAREEPARCSRTPGTRRPVHRRRHRGRHRTGLVTLTGVTLVRGLGLLAATAIVVGDVIGTGVFLKARVMTCNVGSPGLVVTVWVVGGLLSLAGALTYAELAVMMPRAGGEYVFIREAYGRLWGFLYGWTRFFVASTGGPAGLAARLAVFLNISSGGTLGARHAGAPPIVPPAAIKAVRLVNSAAGAG